MNSVPALTLAPPAVEQRAQPAASAQAYTVHGVDTVCVATADISRPGPGWGA